MGVRVFATRGETLATGTNTTDAAATFKVKGPGNRPILRSVNISLGNSQGPCLSAAFLFKEPGNINGVALGPTQWIRTSLLGGVPSDFFQWYGEAPLSGESEIRIYVRNDTGSTVNWTARWVTDG